MERIIKKIFLFIFICLTTFFSSGQTFSWSTYSNATNSPVGATDYSKVIVAGSVTGVATITSIVNGVSDNSVFLSSSPKYIASDPNDGCGTQNNFQSGLFIYVDWTDYGTSAATYPYVNVLVNFNGASNGVCGPVSFSIYDINSDNCSTNQFRDWVEVTAYNAAGAYIKPTIGSGTQNCNFNMGTYSNPASPGPLTYNGSCSCGCWPDYITVGSAGTVISSINIKYYPDHVSNLYQHSPRDPYHQHIVISDFTTGGTTGCVIVLPVDLASFTTKCVGAKKMFNWQTITETNNAFFTLEKSKDGELFEPLAKIEGKGNNSTEKNYSYSYEEENAAYKYYQLKQTDFNGNTKFLKLTYLNCVDAVGNLKLAPNPANNEIKLEFEASKESVFTINVTDLMGRLLKSTQHTASEGFNQALVDIQDLPPGSYQVSINSNTGSRPQILRFIKNIN